MKQELDETVTGGLVNEVESLKNRHADVFSPKDQDDKTGAEKKKIIKELEQLMKDNAAASPKEK